MVRRTVSINQPRTTFRVPHDASPFVSFFVELGSVRQGLSDFERGRRTWSMVENRVHRTVRRSSFHWCWVKAMKSSMYTSTVCKGACSGPRLRVSGRGKTSSWASPVGSSSVGAGAVSASLSRWWNSRSRSPEANRSLVRSAKVSVMAQRYGGLSIHPIGKIMGKPTMGSSPSKAGMMAPKSGIEWSWIQRRMNASATSTFAM